MKHNLLKSVIISVILLMGVSNAWAYVTYYLKSNNTTWSTSTNDWGFTHGTTTTTYMDNNGEFKLWRTDWGNDGWFGKGNNTTINLKENDHNGVQLQQWLDGGNVKYVGPSGMVCFHMDQNDGKEASPWVWITRPTFYLKHNWGGGSWTWEALKDNGDGTYTLTAKYGGTGANYGDDNTSQNGWGYIEDKTPDGNPTTSHNCEFKFNSKDKSLTITRLYTITYNGNGHTGGTVPAAIDKKHGTNITLSSSTPTRTGYTFAGWNTKADGTGTNYNASATYSANADVTLYAKWTANTYAVTLNQQSGTGGTTSVTATYNAAMPAITKPTLTGYSFNGYYDATSGGTQYYKADGSSARTWNKTAATTLYAQWTENQYNVTIATDGNGTTTQTGTKQVGIVGINITATPNIGYAFKQWNVTGGAQVADKNSATTKITATAAGTVTAIFEETTYEVHGFGDWNTGKAMTKKPNAQNEKVVYYTYTTNETNNNNEVSNSSFQFKIYEPQQNKWYGLTADGDRYWYTRGMGQKSLDGNNTGKNIELRADVKGNYEIKMDYSDPTSAPKITITYPQKPYYLSGTWDNWVGESPIENTPVTIHLDKGTYEFMIFDYQAEAKYYGNTETMDRNNSAGWTMTDGAGNCRITADITGDYTFTFDASTKKLTVHYPLTITLGKSKFGPFGIKYNGQSYYSKDNDDVTVIVPYGAVINFIEGQPHSNLYTGDIMEKGEVQRFNLNQPYTVLRDVKFESNYVTKEAQIAYLGVPDNCDWDKNASYANFTWRFDSYDGATMTNRNDKAEFAFEANNVKYYKFTIPAGCNKFQIQRKAPKAGDDEANGTTTYSHTGDHSYMVLNTDINCYLLDEGTYNNNTHPGHWCELPAAVGDYRLLYVEQVVEKKSKESGNEWETVVTRKKAHPSDIVRAKEITAEGKIVSLHVYKNRTYEAYLGNGNTYKSSNNPEIILQQYQKVIVDGKEIYKWEDVEWHMVFGPLETLPSMAMLPGRKNASPGSDIDDLKVHPGIANIKNDTHKYQGNGVWNFVIVKKDSKVTLDLTKIHRYEGNYYIRTKAADGGWNSYTCSDNHMPYSTYADDNNFFTHYYCKYIQGGTDVSFVVANDYAQVITHDSLYVDRDFYGNYYETPIVGNKTLPAENANVRFSWDEETNITSRAYIAGSFGGDNEFLVVKNQDDKVTLQNNNNNQLGYFNDNTNWLYYADVLAKPQAKAQVVAKYNKINQYFMGEESGDNQYEQLIGGTTNDTKYPIRILYEFPEHRFVVAYVPPTTITGDVAIETPVMLIRENHEAPNQITFSDKEKKITAPLPAYGAITFTEGFLTDDNKTQYEKALYWISFPFNVRISDAFGMGKYGEDWIIEEYDGKSRSEVGLTYYNTFWKYILETDYVLNAGQGYVLCLDLDRVNSMFLDGNNKNEKISLYFPSMENIAWRDIKTQEPKDMTIPSWTSNKTKEKDHNWNLIGVVSYANTGESTQQENTNFLYEYQPAGDTYKAKTSNGYTFNALHAYMVQYGGKITWTSHIAPQAIAAKNNTYNEEYIHRLSLNLIQNGATVDQTFFQLEDGEATQMFDLNIDMTKIINTGANIYSISSDKNQLAGNVLPVEETIIPIGIKLDKAGEYTFAMPDGTDGIVVELIDYETNTRTNMLLDEYTVNLGKGTFENRFALHVKPNKTVTSIESITTPSDSEVRKFIIDGVLYMQKDGVLYDAQGRCVK